MKLYRFTQVKYAKVLDGKGAALNPGRWNSFDNPMIYASSTASLAFIELLRRFKPNQIPLSYCLVEYTMEQKVGIQNVHWEELPKNWDAILHTAATQRIGDLFLAKAENLLLQVPSALLPIEYHYNVNPRHKDIDKVCVSRILDHPVNRFLFLE